MRPFLMGLSVLFLAIPSLGAPDMDGDGVPDVIDNCMLVSNASPFDCDDDFDGYGNLCDCDFDNSFICGGPDFSMFMTAFSSSGTAAGEDMNCDGIVGGPDFGQFLPFFTGPPGPSGFSCAGIFPCP